MRSLPPLSQLLLSPLACYSSSLPSPPAPAFQAQLGSALSAFQVVPAIPFPPWPLGTNSNPTFLLHPFIQIRFVLLLYKQLCALWGLTAESQGPTVDVQHVHTATSSCHPTTTPPSPMAQHLRGSPWAFSSGDAGVSEELGSGQAGSWSVCPVGREKRLASKEKKISKLNIPPELLSHNQPSRRNPPAIYKYTSNPESDSPGLCDLGWAAPSLLLPSLPSGGHKRERFAQCIGRPT